MKVLKVKNYLFVHFGNNVFQSNSLEAMWCCAVKFLEPWLWQALSNFWKMEVCEVNHKREKYSFEKERINREKELHLWLWRASA